MKKILLALALVFSFHNLLKASVPDFKAASGWYIVQQGGVSILSLSGEGTFYDISLVDGTLTPMSFNDSNSKTTIPFLGMQLNWGYLHRFQNNLTMGAEFTVLSPAVRVGYLANGRHHVSAALHYAAVARLGFGYLVSLAESKLSQEKKDAFHLELTGLSGLGISGMYEYFTSRGNFFRFQVRADYYALEGNVGTTKKLRSNFLPFIIDGKGTVWDVTAYFGIGTQW